MIPTATTRRGAFTRTEAIVLLLMVILCIGLLLPAIRTAHDSDYFFSRCANNLKQISLASATSQDVFPGERPLDIPDDELPPEDRLSWFVSILPFLEEGNLYRSLDLSEGWASQANGWLKTTRVRTFQCRSLSREDSEAQWTTYVGAGGVGRNSLWLGADHPRAGVLGYDRPLSLTGLSDGESNSFLLLTTSVDNGPWYAGGSATLRSLDPGRRPFVGKWRQFGGVHGERMNVAMADGSARVLTDDISPEVFEAMMTINGGEPVREGDW